MHSSLLTQFPVVWNSLQGNSRSVGIKEKHSGEDLNLTGLRSSLLNV